MTRLTVEFIPSSPEVDATVPTPKPASEYTPKWYKDISMFMGDEGPQFEENGNTVHNITVKACGPFGDSFKMGWIQETWSDMWVRKSPVDPNAMEMKARREMMVKVRSRVGIPLPNHFYPYELVFYTPWIAKLPPGYSMLVTQPHNHFELPFYVPTGVIDADKFFHTRFGNLPFYIYKGFEGLIPAGTPMFQMIPVKRDAWDSKRDGWTEKEIMQRHTIMGSEFWGTYRQKFRQRKDYK